MAAPSWFRQFRVLLTRNRRLLHRRPVHLSVLLLSSVLSVVLAWVAGRDANGPPGEFPPLNECGMVDPIYVTEIKMKDEDDPYGYSSVTHDIPASLNEAWRGGLPVWVMGLGPTAAAVSVFLVLRDEIQSRRWGTLGMAAPSALWLSWLAAFSALGAANSLLGAVLAAALPGAHALSSVNFGSVFALLLFLNLALAAASLFLAAACGTCQSTALSILLVVGMIVAGSAPAIFASATMDFWSNGADAALDTYSHPWGSGGAFWMYGSTGRTAIDYDDDVYWPETGDYVYDPETDEYVYQEPQGGVNDASDENSTAYTARQCEVPLISYEQSRIYKTPDEQDNFPKEDIFQGCYVLAGASSQLWNAGASTFFWYLLPQSHFLAAWSNILGYTALPGNQFSLAEAAMSPEELAREALANYRGDAGLAYGSGNGDGPSLFPQGSTILTEEYYDPYHYRNYYDDPAEQKSTCPSSKVSDLCNDYNTICHNPKPRYPSVGSPSVNDDIGFLASLVVVYSLLAAYVMAVLPMGNGAALRPYFPFQLGYWLGGRRGGEGEGRDGVEAVGVSKSYGSVRALKPFSLKMEPGEVTAILGHNGAGKTTFVNLLCCEQNPTGGDIVVRGRSAASEQRAVSKMIGQCRQDDFLWPSLTAGEHLELFGGLRGVRREEMAGTVQRWLESVDLENVQHVRAGTFSGGMKRRLSVALATIGDASVVVLDEPTTGMDPVSRRFVWKHISDVKAGRVILLTTHAMEEADLLSDQVAIMNQGELAALGSPLELKTKYGSALQLSLISQKENAGVVEEKVKSTFASSLSYVDFNASDSGYSTVTIKKVRKDVADSKDALQPAPVVAVPVLQNESPDAPEAPALLDDADAHREGVTVTSLAEFIGWLEGEDSPVEEFGLTNSSLEEVFLAVTRHAGPAATPQHVERRGCCSCCCGGRPARTSSEADVVESGNALPIPSHNFTQLPKADISGYERRLSAKTQTMAIVRFLFARNWTGRPSIVNWIIFPIFGIINMICGFWMAMLWPDSVSWYILLVSVTFLSFMLISIISPIYSDRNNGLFKMLSTQSMMERSFLLGTSLYSFLVQLGYSFVFLTLFFASHIFRTASTPECKSSSEPSSLTDDNYTDDYYAYDYDCGWANFGDKPVVGPYYRTEVLSGADDGNEVLVYAHMAPGGYGMLLAIIVVFSLSTPGAVLSSAFLPGFKLTLVGISLVLLAACVSPGILHLTYALDPFFFQNCTEYAQSSLDCSASEFTLENATSDFVECVGWQLTGFPLVPCTPAYAGILPQMGLFQTLSLTLMSDIVIYSEPKEYAQQFVTGLVEGGAACSGNRCKFKYARQLWGENLGFMFVGAILLIILGMVMATLMIYPSSCMVRAKHVIGALFNCRKKQNETSSEQVEEMKEVDAERQHVHTIMQPLLLEPADLEANNSHTPILSSSARVSNRDNLPPVVMHKLRKVFPSLGGVPPKVALKGLDLAVPKGQVLGLLGKNGAGKTTALKILAGMHDASSGIGLISGYDVETERNSVYERLGNCPQFDCVWKDQSVQRHLEFYARLKGINDPTKAAWEIANAVGLGAPEVYRRPSGSLSGGMRRRLSIAVSLIGSPNCLLLDEPTTGLDPSTRNEIWSLVSSFATTERAIIITTHMMLEADALCSRIAIVAKGSLKVVGTQQHLKDNYGSGYLLQLNLAHDNEKSINSLLQFVKANIHQDAKIVTKQAKTIHINLPRDVNIQKIFTTLYSDRAAEAMINQFLVSQSSLEDVFLALGE